MRREVVYLHAKVNLNYEPNVTKFKTIKKKSYRSKELA